MIFGAGFMRQHALFHSESEIAAKIVHAASNFAGYFAPQNIITRQQQWASFLACVIALVVPIKYAQFKPVSSTCSAQVHVKPTIDSELKLRRTEQYFVQINILANCWVLSSDFEVSA